MPLLIDPAPPQVALIPKTDAVSTAGGSGVRVTGWDGQPAEGRTVIALGLDVWGQWAVKAQTTTDADGEYSLTVNAGPNDPLIAVCVGLQVHAEHTRALGSLQVS